MFTAVPTPMIVPACSYATRKEPIEGLGGPVLIIQFTSVPKDIRRANIGLFQYVVSIDVGSNVSKKRQPSPPLPFETCETAVGILGNQLF